MSAIAATVLADLRRKKLQGLIIFVVILLSSLAATLALNLLVETDGPYDRAFAAANGAHITMTFDGESVSPAELASTSSASGVVATAGPWAVTTTGASIGVGASKGAPSAGVPATQRHLAIPLRIAGRTEWNTEVDRLTIQTGRWVEAADEIVLSRGSADSLGMSTGDTLQLDGANGPLSFTVVGIAASISPASVDAWVLPAQVPALASSSASIDQEMLYRVSPSATDDDLRAASQAIVSGLPQGAVVNSANYLDAKRDADLTTAVMIPFIAAFSIFGLVISVLIIGNVVSGSIISGYREIGILKALGMTPGQVSGVLILQIVITSLAGCLFGVPLGILASVPFLQTTAQALGLPAAYTATIPLGLTVFATVLALATLTALLVSWRAAHVSAIQALAKDALPSHRATRLSSWFARLPFPRAISLGLGDTFASPLRSAMTTGAILLGVATVVFGLGLHLSLGQISEQLQRDIAVPVSVHLPSGGPGKGNALIAPTGKGGPAPDIASPSQTIDAVRANPDTARMTVEGATDVSITGIAEPIPYYAYQDDSSWTGYALIAGRWFDGPGEVVAPSALIDQAHLQIGDHFTAHVNDTSVELTLVGEVLDRDGNGLLLRGDWSTVAALDPALQPDAIEIGLQPGVDPDVYAAGLQQSLPGVALEVAERASANETFRLFNLVIVGLALVLVVIALAGVFNTVVLNTRERARDIAILKAVGMAPAQVVAMVVGTVVLLGVLGGALAIPLGLVFHHQILSLMGRVANVSRIPAGDYAVFSPFILAMLGLAGVVLSALGAFIPARWAASGSTSHVLHAE